MTQLGALSGRVPVLSSPGPRGRRCTPAAIQVKVHDPLAGFSA